MSLHPLLKRLQRLEGETRPDPVSAVPDEDLLAAIGHLIDMQAGVPGAEGRLHELVEQSPALQAMLREIHL